jgi:superoxide dismutase, Cu-Zn family
MTMTRWMVGCTALVLVYGAEGLAQDPTAGKNKMAAAAANFVDAEGQPVGTARLQQLPHGMLLSIDLTNAAPGPHALHLHTVGRCDAPSFESAGGHYNPGRKAHGFMSAAGPHAGDLPNVVVPESRKLTAEYLVHGAMLIGASGAMDADGAALVIHGGKDDYASDPAGGAGARIACAVLVAEGR